MDANYLEQLRMTVLAGGDPSCAQVRMDDDPCLDNHVASRHAGALFSLADATAAALVGRTTAGAGWERRTTTISYDRIARGVLTATARWEAPGIAIDIRDERGNVVAAAHAVSAAGAPAATA